MKHFLNALMIALFSVGLLNFPAEAHASVPSKGFETISLGSVVLQESETRTLPLGSLHYVRNLVISAEGFWNDSTIEVMVNGIVKGTIYAPGNDPSYVVTIGETTNSIQFRHRSGGAMHIRDVLATVSEATGHPTHEESFHGSGDDMRVLAKRALKAVAALKDFTSTSDELTYLYPVKEQAGLVLINTEGHGEHSQRAIDAIRMLETQIDHSHAYLESLMQNEDAFDWVVELLSIRETIDDLID
jgi:hypothetical protein